MTDEQVRLNDMRQALDLLDLYRKEIWTAIGDMRSTLNAPPDPQDHIRRNLLQWRLKPISDAVTHMRRAVETLERGTTDATLD